MQKYNALAEDGEGEQCAPTTRFGWNKCGMINVLLLTCLSEEVWFFFEFMVSFNLLVTPECNHYKESWSVQQHSATPPFSFFSAFLASLTHTHTHTSYENRGSTMAAGCLLLPTKLESSGNNSPSGRDMWCWLWCCYLIWDLTFCPRTPGLLATGMPSVSMVPGHYKKLQVFALVVGRQLGTRMMFEPSVPKQLRAKTCFL